MYARFAVCDRRAGRLAALTMVTLMAACTPFQRETPGSAAEGPGASSGSGASSGPGAAALLAAQSRIGTPYRYGGSGPEAFDCSGLVAYAYQQAGVAVPRTAAQQYALARPVRRAELRAGDLVFFRLSGRNVSHVGIYAGDGQFVHAPQTGGLVRTASLDDEWYRERYAGAGRPY
jgi:cell wall-associated NlpC family hydrolase